MEELSQIQKEKLKEKYGEDFEKFIGCSLADLVDNGICPTCFNRETNGSVFGDETNLRVFKDDDIDCLFVANPRADGHMMIATMTHFHDMSEAPDWLNEKIVRFSKALMKIICEVFGCERVYLCTMCDGKNNHFHVQLIPRYPFEQRGSKNFVKPRHGYVFDKEKFEKVQKAINEFAKNDK